uniref:Uncharacterized protein n=1 Tax=Solanum lycopersicum TaxID=4081 RepID=A0A3Q7FH80_SOLLC
MLGYHQSSPATFQLAFSDFRHFCYTDKDILVDSREGPLYSQQLLPPMKHLMSSMAALSLDSLVSHLKYVSNEGFEYINNLSISGNYEV